MHIVKIKCHIKCTQHKLKYFKPPDLDIVHKLIDRKRWHSNCRRWCIKCNVPKRSHSILNGFIACFFFNVYSRSFCVSVNRTNWNWIELKSYWNFSSENSILSKQVLVFLLLYFPPIVTQSLSTKTAASCYMDEIV